MDHLLEGDREGEFVLVRMGADEFDDLAVAACGGLFLATRLVDHPEAMVSVMGLGLMLKECSGRLFVSGCNLYLSARTS